MNDGPIEPGTTGGADLTADELGIEALRGGPVDLEELTSRPQTERRFPIVDGYADGPRGVDQREESNTSYDGLGNELVRSVDDPEALHEPGLDTPAGRLAAIENAARRGVGFTLFGVRYVPEAQTPEATGAPSDAVIPSPAPSAASPLLTDAVRRLIALDPVAFAKAASEAIEQGRAATAPSAIAANPRRPRTLEDAKATTGFSTSGAEPTVVSPRQPR